MLAYRDLVEGGESGMESAQIGEWLDRLDAERENVRAAMTFAVADGDADTALLFCADLWRYWIWRGNLTEGRELLAAALALDGRRAGAAPARAQRRGRGGGRAGRLRARKRLFERALALAPEVGDDYRAARDQRQPRQPRALRARLRRGDRALRGRRRRSCARSTTRAGSA